MNKKNKTLFEFNQKNSHTLSSSHSLSESNLIFQTDFSLHILPFSDNIKNRLLTKYLYFFPNQLEFISSYFQIPIPYSYISPTSILDITYNDDTDVMLKKYDNYLITTSTSSGKTLIALLYMISFLERYENGTVVYVVPIRSLGNEKYTEFSELFSNIYDIHLVMGNEEKYNGKDSKKNILITTNEKFDLLLRNEHKIKNIRCVVFDELHLLNTNRGLTIEWCIAKIKTLHIPIMGLSATINNAKEIANWLNAGLISSSFRPIPITYGIFTDTSITLFDEHEKLKTDVNLISSDIPIIENSYLYTFLVQCILSHSSLIYFRQSRPNVMSIAKKIAEIIKKRYTIITSLELPEIKGGKNGIDATLNEYIKYGVAFHHAGLSSKNKAYIEEKFKNREIYVLIATPTLAMGVNVPAKYVIVDYKAYRNGIYDDLSVSEVKQMLGRAARPKYDREGFAFLYEPKCDKKKQHELYMKYFDGNCEPIVSQYQGFSDLLMSILGFIAGNYARTETQLLNVYKNSLIYYQSSDFKSSLRKNVADVFEYYTSVSPLLLKKKENNWELTEFGILVNKLYIHPNIALSMYFFLLSNEYTKNEVTILYFLFSQYEELRIFRKKNSDSLFFDEIFTNLEKKNVILYEKDDVGIHLDALKTAILLIGNEYYSKMVWCDDTTDEDTFLQTYDIYSGDLYQLIGSESNLEWLLHSLQQIAYYYKLTVYANLISEIIIRLKYGISKKLVPLCKIKYVGKKYAKTLYLNNYKTSEDLVFDALPHIASLVMENGSIIGKTMAEKIILHAQKNS